MNKCKECGMDCDLAHRYCPRCGNQVYLSLDVQDAAPELFIPLINSLYNLLAIDRGTSGHPDRAKYLSELSEKVMIRRCHIEHQMMMRGFFIFRPINVEATEVHMDLYKLALSNALAGYAYRSVEEIICKKKSERLTQPEKARLIASMYEEYGSELAKSGYNELRPVDEVDGRLLFCLALRWNNRHLKYLLAEEGLQKDWWKTILYWNCKLSEQNVERVLRALGLLQNDNPLSQSNREKVWENAEQDLMHGYVVRLSESLDPL